MGVFLACCLYDFLLIYGQTKKNEVKKKSSKHEGKVKTLLLKV